MAKYVTYVDDAIYTLIFPTRFISDHGGQHFEFTYEEMVELMNGGIQKVRGNEAFDNMKNKAREIFKALPVTDY